MPTTAITLHTICSEDPALSPPQGLTLKRHIEATLGSGNIREAVQLPPGEDLNEWLAVNTVDFYNAISVLFGTLEEFCTASSCPVMSAGPKVIPCSLSLAHNFSCPCTSICCAQTPCHVLLSKDIKDGPIIVYLMLKTSTLSMIQCSRYVCFLL